jgi:hypothetical protein
MSSWRCAACPRRGPWCPGPWRAPRLCELAALERAAAPGYDGWLDRIAAEPEPASHPAEPPLRYAPVVTYRAQAPYRAAAPFASADAFLAPARRRADGTALDPGSAPRAWEGSGVVKPWDYKVAAAVAHLDAPGPLAVVLETLRAQTVRPYLIVVDTGSLAEHRPALEAMELASDDLEIHYLRPRGWRASSQPVAAAMDLAFAACQAEYLYATHTDVFLKRPDYLEWLLARCDATTPVVGYRMSPRPDWGNDLWRACPSHTATLYHMPTMRKERITWNMLAAMDLLGLPPGQPPGCFPDTETMVGLSLRAAGIGVRELADSQPAAGTRSVLMIGDEPNEPYEDHNLVHERSYTCRALYDPAGAGARAARMARAMEDAQARVRRWRKPRVALGQPHCVPCVAAKQAPPG